MTYIISISFILFTTVFIIAKGGGQLLWAVDVPSLLITGITILTALIASNSVKDFFLGIKIAASRKTYQPLQIAHSINAITLVIQSVLGVSFMVAFLCITTIFFLVNEKRTPGYAIILGLLSLFYAMEVAIILLPAKSILQKKLGSSKTSPLIGSIKISNLPGKPYIAFIFGIVLIFISMEMGNAFALRNFPLYLKKSISTMLIFLYVASYILLLSSNMIPSYFKALGLGFKRTCNENLESLEHYIKIIDFVITIRLTVAFGSAALLSAIGFGIIENPEEIAQRFSIPCALAALSFLTVLYLFPLRARIQKLIDYRIYGGRSQQSV